jgi:hypothetical protein
MRALAYLELRYAAHHIAAIFRSPFRLVLWAPYIFSVAYLSYSRFSNHHHGSLLNLSVHQPRTATVIAGLYLGILGTTAGIAAAGRVAAFRTGAEAVLFSNAGIPPLSVALWLQLRKLSLGSLRWFASLAYLFILAAPRHATGATTLRVAAGAVLAIGLLMTSELPAFLLARRASIPVYVVAWGTALFGFSFAALAAVGDRFLPPLIAATGLNPGAFATALLSGQMVPVSIVAVLLALQVASMLVLGNDALPELFAVTQRTLAVRSGRRRMTRETTFLADRKNRAVRIPAGALALIWKDWVGFRRGRGQLQLWLAGGIFWSLCGAGAAYASMRFEDPAPLISVAAMSAMLILISAPMVASLGLAADLSKPLFWLSRDSLRARLSAWTFARSWRGGSAIALAPALAGIVAGDVALALVAVPLCVAAYWSLQALGVGLFAVFPNPIDSRGPMMLVRLALTGAYVVPAFAVALVSAAFNADPTLAALLFVLTLGIEGWLVIEVASYRFREYGASIASLSRAT